MWLIFSLFSHLHPGQNSISPRWKERTRKFEAGFSQEDQDVGICFETGAVSFHIIHSHDTCMRPPSVFKWIALVKNITLMYQVLASVFVCMSICVFSLSEPSFINWNMAQSWIRVTWSLQCLTKMRRVSGLLLYFFVSMTYSCDPLIPNHWSIFFPGEDMIDSQTMNTPNSNVTWKQGRQLLRQLVQLSCIFTSTTGSSYGVCCSFVSQISSGNWLHRHYHWCEVSSGQTAPRSAEQCQCRRGPDAGQWRCHMQAAQWEPGQAVSASEHHHWSLCLWSHLGWCSLWSDSFEYLAELANCS